MGKEIALAAENSQRQTDILFSEYSATLQASVICRGYVGILLSARVIP